MTLNELEQRLKDLRAIGATDATPIVTPVADEWVKGRYQSLSGASLTTLAPVVKVDGERYWVALAFAAPDNTNRERAICL